jgi:hypothetical protein
MRGVGAAQQAYIFFHVLDFFREEKELEYDLVKRAGLRDLPA